MSLFRNFLVLGGASSGKSLWAETRALSTGLRPTYIATATVYDAEMQSKVERHKDRRADIWTTVEAPMALPDAVRSLAVREVCLIDCATLWLTNLMLAGADIDAATDDLIAAIEACAAPVVLVSNDVSGGITPDNAMARRFQRIQGGFNQRMAAEMENIALITAGLPLLLKGAL